MGNRNTYPVRLQMCTKGAQIEVSVPILPELDCKHWSHPLVNYSNTVMLSPSDSPPWWMNGFFSPSSCACWWQHMPSLCVYKYRCSSHRATQHKNQSPLTNTTDPSDRNGAIQRQMPSSQPSGVTSVIRSLNIIPVACTCAHETRHFEPSATGTARESGRRGND